MINRLRQFIAELPSLLHLQPKGRGRSTEQSLSLRAGAAPRPPTSETCGRASFVSSVVGVGRAPLLGTCLFLTFDCCLLSAFDDYYYDFFFFFFAGGEGRSLAMKLIV